MKGEMMYREVVVLDKSWGWVIYGGGSLRQRDGAGRYTEVVVLDKSWG